MSSHSETDALERARDQVRLENTARLVIIRALDKLPDVDSRVRVIQDLARVIEPPPKIFTEKVENGV